MAIGITLLFLFKDNSILSDSAEAASNEGRQLQSTYEPSAALQLASGKIVVLEDEGNRFT